MSKFQVARVHGSLTRAILVLPNQVRRYGHGAYMTLAAHANCDELWFEQLKAVYKQGFKKTNLSISDSPNQVLTHAARAAATQLFGRARVKGSGQSKFQKAFTSCSNFTGL